MSAWLASLVFLGAWYQQLQAHKIFAQLKVKNSAGHSIPEGALFDLVSCPHYLCEIITVPQRPDSKRQGREGSVCLLLLGTLRT